MVSPPAAQGQTSGTCAQYQNFTIASTPGYIVQTNYWNMGACPGTQCVTVNTTTGDYTVTANFTCGDNVATYPSIFYGAHYGTYSPGTNLPMLVSALTCVTSSWTIGTTSGGYWDAAYDIWFSPTAANPSSHNAELMIWLNYANGTGAGGSLKATNVSLAGNTWNLYEGNVGWNYIAYLATPTVNSFNDTDILAFINDSVTRGYIQTSWYLDDIEAGNELRTGGSPFTSSGFNASVNGALCGTPTPPFTPTPTPTNTPCGYPGNTCTSTNTPTPTDSPTPTATPNPNNNIPWPNPWDGSQPISFYHTLSTPADSVALKVYTISFRKVCEVDNLATGKGQPNNWQTAYSLSWSQLGNVANGFYYVVLEERRGHQVTRSVVKVIIRR